MIEYLIFFQTDVSNERLSRLSGAETFGRGHGELDQYVVELFPLSGTKGNVDRR